jgi:hypothetical protein
MKKTVIKYLEELENYNFAYSKIISVFLNNEVIEINKYNKFFLIIFYTIGDGCKIIKNTTIAIKTIKKTIEGYTFLKELGISVQGIDSNKCINEIVNQCISNNINLTIQIYLATNDIIYIDI